MTRKVEKSLQEWARTLTPEQFRVTRQKGTERAFTGEYDQHQEDGQYRCVCCGEVLFDSSSKFDAGCGWPSFSEPAEHQKIEEQSDLTLGMRRTEVLCDACGAHLGHVFPDGPKPSGQRYCINSAALDFVKRHETEES